jgi:tetrahydromethanopterin S-methyltransferase subunit G
MIDKFLNTARGLMETRVKTDEAQLIAARLDELEKRMESIMSAQSRHQSTPIEVWHE